MGQMTNQQYKFVYFFQTDCGESSCVNWVLL